MRFDKSAIGYVVIVILLAATGFFSFNLYLQEKKAHDRLDISVFPREVMGWQGRDLPLTEKEYSILETRNLISREYTNPSGEKIYLFIIYSETNRAVFHPPEVCLIGSGVNIVDKQREHIKFDDHDFFVSKLYLENGPVRQLALYCYKAGKFYTDNFYLQQAYLALHQMFGRLVPGATIRLVMLRKNGEETVLPVMKKFLEETIVVLDGLS